MIVVPRWLPVLLLTSSLVWITSASADIGKVPGGLEDLHAAGSDIWIYNDLPSAIAEARRTNKPLFVTFRCIPCNACKGFDAEVAKGNEGVHELARKEFISVRQIEMKGVDLSQFQFDHDLNWAAMFINADGTVYARYGTQSADGPDTYNSLASLEACMKRVLALHKSYPTNKLTLATKHGADKPYKTAMEMPGLERKDQRVNPTTRQNCIHCHNIHDAEQKQWYDEGTFTMDKLYRWPLPENVGLKIDRDHGRLVQAVVADSAAAKAGIHSGDEITHVAGQPITSIADMQWPLHNLPNDDATVDITVTRDGKSSNHKLQLAKGWKQIDFTWRGSMWSLRPRPGFWAPQLEDDRAKQLGLTDQKVLRVQFLNANVPEGKAAYDAGLRQNDVIVAIEGKPMNMTPKEFQVHVRLNYGDKTHLNLTIMRDGKRRDVKIPLVQ